MVVFLLVLAVTDLFVGVSNDAANFLNAAVGSRIAPFVVIVLTASAGVLLGATFSSGMMEVARKGVFYPEMFTFPELMTVFFAVVVTDVLVLNFFNYLGLPTSTTVSIVFELLGASTFAALYKLNSHGLPLTDLFSYIKSDRALTIVSAILISVVVAFAAGAVVQFFCRLLFSFRLERPYRYLGGVFCGFAMTAIFYFLVMKGARDSAFMKPEYIAFLEANTDDLLLGLFIALSVLGQVLVAFGCNVFRIIILGGTFALAFSFAGNDLVNFIGVPLAALDSYEMWSASGLDPEAVTMESLNSSARTSPLYLAAAGLIMCLTICFSKKARRVVQTAINLSSSSRGEHEQFGASTPGRIITRVGLGISRACYKVLPRPALALVASRYRRRPVVKGEIPLPFDHVRASLNLIIAAVLISSATSLKLPLSTTYVTFMVAMGTSFADGAWDRETAVYRISGVITVIAGWFLTGMISFSAACLVCMGMCYFGTAGIFVMMILVAAVVVKTNFIKRKVNSLAASVLGSAHDNAELFRAVAKAIPTFLDLQVECVRRSLDAFFSDDELASRRVRNKASNILDGINQTRSEYYTLALDITDQKPRKGRGRGKAAEAGKREQDAHAAVDAKHFFYLAFSNMREGSKALLYGLDQAVEHVANRHTIFGGQMRQSLYDLLRRLERVGQDMHAIAELPTAENVASLVKHAKKLNRDVDRCQLSLVELIGRSKVTMHSSEMYLTFLQMIRDIANRCVSVGMQERALSQIAAGEEVGEGGDRDGMQSEVLPSATVSGNEAVARDADADDDDDEDGDQPLVEVGLPSPPPAAAPQPGEAPPPDPQRQS
ncbi:MAG: inorganic phosphate transporter [Succinivibrionaceae bacterium]|nr:inorganic phosphate transporter [Succinivibrionaceae bacterium]